MRNLLLNEGLSVPKSSFLHNVKATPGLHLIGDLFECSCDLSIFTDSKFLENTCSSFVQNAGLTEVGKFFHQFDGEGVLHHRSPTDETVFRAFQRIGAR